MGFHPDRVGFTDMDQQWFDGLECKNMWSPSFGTLDSFLSWCHCSNLVARSSMHVVWAEELLSSCGNSCSG